MKCKNDSLSPDIFKELEISAYGVQFSVWAPSAEAVRLLLYVDGMFGPPYRVEPMYPVGGGRWSVRLTPFLLG